MEGEDRLAPILRDGAYQSRKEKRALSLVWSYVAARFRYRTIRSVERRLLRLLHPYSASGPWTADEKRRLLELVGLHGRKWRRSWSARPPISSPPTAVLPSSHSTSSADARLSLW